jgi:hypothetical protein
MFKNKERSFSVTCHYRDIVAVMSMFGFLNCWNDTLTTPLENEPLEVAQQLLTERGWEVGKHSSS